MKRIFLFFFVVFMAFPALASYKRLKIVTTYPPIQSLVWGVTEGVNPVNLMFSRPLSEHHNIQLKPSHMKVLQGADVVFYASDELETFMEDAVKAVAPNAKVYSLQKETPDLLLLPTASDPDKKDMHYWMDYRNALLMVDKIAEIMIELDPANKNKYLENTEKSKKYINQLKLVGQIDKEKKFLALHDGFNYMADSFGLDIKTLKIDMENIDTPKLFNDVKKEIQKESADCYLVEPQTDARLLKSLDLRGKDVLKIDAFGWNLSSGDGQYYRMMGWNLERMAKCKKKR